MIDRLDRDIKQVHIHYIPFSHFLVFSQLSGSFCYFCRFIYDVFEYSWCLFLQQLTQTLFSDGGTNAEEQGFHFLCKRMLSKCFYNGHLDLALMFTAWKKTPTNEKYISLKTPLPFPRPLWCIYNHFLTALYQGMWAFLDRDTVQYHLAYRNLPEGRMKCRKYHWEETSGSFDLYLTCKLHINATPRSPPPPKKGGDSKLEVR